MKASTLLKNLFKRPGSALAALAGLAALTESAHAAEPGPVAAPAVTGEHASAARAADVVPADREVVAADAPAEAEASTPDGEPQPLDLAEQLEALVAAFDGSANQPAYGFIDGPAEDELRESAVSAGGDGISTQWLLGGAAVAALAGGLSGGGGGGGSSGGSAPTPVTPTPPVVPVPLPPEPTPVQELVADTVNVTYRGATSGNVLANDQHLAVATRVDSYTVNGATFAADGVWHGIAGFGQLRMWASGNYQYRGVPAVSGELAPIEYKVGSQVGTLTITVAEPVTIAAVDAASTEALVEVTGSVAANDINQSYSPVATYTVAGQTFGADGGVNVLAGIGAISMTAAGVYSFTPAVELAGQALAVSYAYANGASSTLDVTVVAPAITANPDVTAATPALETTGNVVANDSNLAASSVTTFTVAGQTFVADGGVNVLAGLGAISMTAAGDYSFTPAVELAGQTLTIGYAYASGASSTLDVTVGAPAITANADVTTATSALETTGNVVANDVNLAAAPVTTYTVGEQTFVADGGVNVLAGLGAISMTAAGDYSFTPAVELAGQTLTIGYAYASGASSTLDVTVEALTIANPDAAPAIPLFETTGNVAANDVNPTAAPVATYTVAGHTFVADGGVNILDGLGIISMTAAGDYSFTPAAELAGQTLSIGYAYANGVSSSLDVTVRQGQLVSGTIAAPTYGLQLDVSGLDLTKATELSFSRAGQEQLVDISGTSDLSTLFNKLVAAGLPAQMVWNADTGHMVIELQDSLPLTGGEVTAITPGFSELTCAVLFQDVSAVEPTNALALTVSINGHDYTAVSHGLPDFNAIVADLSQQSGVPVTVKYAVIDPTTGSITVTFSAPAGVIFGADYSVEQASAIYHDVFVPGVAETVTFDLSPAAVTNALAVLPVPMSSELWAEASATGSAALQLKTSANLTLTPDQWSLLAQSAGVNMTSEQMTTATNVLANYNASLWLIGNVDVAGQMNAQLTGQLVSALQAAQGVGLSAEDASKLANAAGVAADLSVNTLFQVAAGADGQFTYSNALGNADGYAVKLLLSASDCMHISNLDFASLAAIDLGSALLKFGSDLSVPASLDDMATELRTRLSLQVTIDQAGTGLFLALGPGAQLKFYAESPVAAQPEQLELGVPLKDLTGLDITATREDGYSYTASIAVDMSSLADVQAEHPEWTEEQCAANVVKSALALAGSPLSLNADCVLQQGGPFDSFLTKLWHVESCTVHTATGDSEAVLVQAAVAQVPGTLAGSSVEIFSSNSGVHDVTTLPATVVSGTPEAIEHPFELVPVDHADPASVVVLSVASQVENHLVGSAEVFESGHATSSLDNLQSLLNFAVGVDLISLQTDGGQHYLPDALTVMGNLGAHDLSDLAGLLQGVGAHEAAVFEVAAGGTMAEGLYAFANNAEAGLSGADYLVHMGATTLTSAEIAGNLEPDTSLNILGFPLADGYYTDYTAIHQVFA